MEPANGVLQCSGQPQKTGLSAGKVGVWAWACGHQRNMTFGVLQLS